jgi:hypothetical protein
MNASWRDPSPIYILFAAALICGNPMPTSASGAGESAAAKQPTPDREKKVFTNDDLEAMYGKPSVAGEMENSEAMAGSSEATQSKPGAPADRRTSIARRETLAPEKDPQWYARQTVAMSDEIASIDSEAQRLIQFRTPGNTPRAGTGLILNAPCEGLTTDNRIAQLLARRQEIEEQMAALQDTARMNGMAPGVFVDASAIVAASDRTPPLTAARRRAALAERVGQLSDQLEETQAVVADMAADTAARNMTLLRPNGYGGNFTTDLLQRLDVRSNNLQDEIINVSDEALREGIPARDLP